MLRNKIHIPLYRLNPRTHKPINPQILLLLCFLCLYSILFAEQDFIYDSGNKRNPFMPLVTSDGRILKLDYDEAGGSILLEGIIYDKGGLSYAIVNGEVLKVGDIISGYRVLKIEKNKVIFVKDGQTIEVDLKEDEP